MIYLWRIPEDYPERHIGIYDRERSPDSYLFDEGVYLEEIIGTSIIRVDKDIEDLRIFDALDNNTMIPLINDRVIKILQSIAPSDVQFIDIIIEAKDGRVLE